MHSTDNRAGDGGDDARGAAHKHSYFRHNRNGTVNAVCVCGQLGPTALTEEAAWHGLAMFKHRHAGTSMHFVGVAERPIYDVAGDEPLRAVVTIRTTPQPSLAEYAIERNRERPPDPDDLDADVGPFL